MKMIHAGITGLTGLTVTGFLSTTVWADPGEAYGGAHMWGSGGYGGFHGPFMMMIGFAILVAIIVAIVMMIVRATDRAGPAGTDAPSSQNPALSILRERFARGEIDTEEFELRRRALDG